MRSTFRNLREQCQTSWVDFTNHLKANVNYISKEQAYACRPSQETQMQLLYRRPTWRPNAPAEKTSLLEPPGRCGAEGYRLLILMSKTHSDRPLFSFFAQLNTNSGLFWRTSLNMQHGKAPLLLLLSGLRGLGRLWHLYILRSCASNILLLVLLHFEHEQTAWQHRVALFLKAQVTLYFIPMNWKS